MVEGTLKQESPKEDFTEEVMRKAGGISWSGDLIALGSKKDKRLWIKMKLEEARMVLNGQRTFPIGTPELSRRIGAVMEKVKEGIYPSLSSALEALHVKVAKIEINVEGSQTLGTTVFFETPNGLEPVPCRTVEALALYARTWTSLYVPDHAWRIARLGDEDLPPASPEEVQVFEENLSKGESQRSNPRFQVFTNLLHDAALKGADEIRIKSKEQGHAFDLLFDGKRQKEGIGFRSEVYQVIAEECRKQPSYKIMLTGYVCFSGIVSLDEKQKAITVTRQE